MVAVGFQSFLARLIMIKGGDGSEWELSRFCNKMNTSVIGGASKLIKYFKTNHSEGLALISYADSRWSDGALYRSIGFEFVDKTPPSFWWLKPNSLARIHRSTLMKHRLVENGGDPSKTGNELAQDLGYSRIWDCGTTKWGDMNKGLPMGVLLLCLGPLSNKYTEPRSRQ